MARLVPVTQRGRLTADTSSMTNYAMSYVAEQVEYDVSILTDVLDMYGSNSEIAMELTGATSKRDTGYKTVMRGLQNLRQGKHSPKYENIIVDLALSTPGVSEDLLLQTARSQSGILSVTFSADVKISEIIEYRTIHADVDASDFLETALNNNFDAYNMIAIAGGYPALDQVFSPVRISF